MSKWARTTPITLAEALAEDPAEQLFGPSYDAHQARVGGQPSRINRTKYRPWKKPRIERGSTTKEQR